MNFYHSLALDRGLDFSESSMPSPLIGKSSHLLAYSTQHHQHSSPSLE